MKGKQLDATAITFGNRNGTNGIFDRNLLEVDDAIAERTPEQQCNLAALQSSRAL
jgi:hypothetical protein